MEYATVYLFIKNLYFFLDFFVYFRLIYLKIKIFYFKKNVTKNKTENRSGKTF